MRKEQTLKGGGTCFWGVHFFSKSVAGEAGTDGHFQASAARRPCGGRHHMASAPPEGSWHDHVVYQPGEETASEPDAES